MRILQILDHVGIYMLIAGTYTPFLLVSLHQHTSAIVLLIFEWIAALLGIIFASKSHFLLYRIDFSNLFFVSFLGFK